MFVCLFFDLLGSMAIQDLTKAAVVLDMWLIKFSFRGKSFLCVQGRQLSPLALRKVHKRVRKLRCQSDVTLED